MTLAEARLAVRGVQAGDGSPASAGSLPPPRPPTHAQALIDSSATAASAAEAGRADGTAGKRLRLPSLPTGALKVG